MASRLSYALPIARQLLLSWARRARPGGLASTLRQPADGSFIVVTGTGRSGTSAVARVLHESGLSMGERFRTPTPENPTGFYEELPVCDLNDAIMAEAGAGNLARWPARSTVLAVGERYRERMRALVSEGSVAGWKDPRFSVTLEAWLPHLPRRPRLVICLRSSEAFLHSVMQAYGLLQRGLIERWWANELRRLLDLVRDYSLEATCVEYDDLVLRPQETIAALSEFLGRPLDAGYVDPGLRHFAYAVPERYARLYEDVRALGPGARKAAATGAEAIEVYLACVRAVDERVEAASAAWRASAGEPPEVSDGLREASAAYVAVLSEAQRELGALPPPAGFERYHEATRAAIDGHRLVAQVALHVAEGVRAPDELDRAYQACLSPEAVAKAKQRREREYARALKSSG
ncbi:MAG: sulfotransferase [Dehalococcoidia bacterium]